MTMSLQRSTSVAKKNNSRKPSYLALLLLLSVQESQSFASLRNVPPLSSSSQRIRNAPQQPKSVDSTSTTTSTERNLYSSVFHDDSSASRNVNNRHSANDWFYNVRSLPKSSVLRDIKNPVSAVFGWATFVSVVHSMLANTPRFVGLANKLCVSSAAHSFLISSLGLLLVFRTNSAYQRFYVSAV